MCHLIAANFDSSTSFEILTSNSKMPRRPANTTFKRVAESDPFNLAVATLKARRSPLVSVCLVLLGIVILLCYAFFNSKVSYHSTKKDIGRFLSEGDFDASFEGMDADNGEGDFLSRPECKAAVCQALPFLQKTYGDAMKHVLHIGPYSCGVVLKLLQKGKHEAWGLLPVEPSPPVHSVCEALIRKGIIRVTDVSQPLNYRSNSFSLVLASDVIETMTMKQLNASLRELTRVSSEGVVLMINARTTQRMPEATSERANPSKALKPRSRLWWQHRFEMVGLEENEGASHQFDALTSTKSFKSNYHVFHLMPGKE